LDQLECCPQAAKTYLERKFETFPREGADGLVRHALQALSASVTDGELTKENCTVAVVGKDIPFTILEGEDLAPHIALLKVREGHPEWRFVLGLVWQLISHVILFCARVCGCVLIVLAAVSVQEGEDGDEGEQMAVEGGAAAAPGEPEADESAAMES
jgi:hypothetical protein